MSGYEGVLLAILAVILITCLGMLQEVGKIRKLLEKKDK
jgi:hypothetical protein